MKIIALLALISLSAISCTFMETQVINTKLNLSVILNVHGNVTTLTVLQFAILYVNHQNVTPVVLNPKTQFAM